jgi:pimeloyl-ACP methyl ester carboxylesterase
MGTPLLLLHGFGGTGDDWRHVFDLDALERSERVLRPTARDVVCKTGDRATHVLELLDELDVPRVRAIGMSLGGNTLLHLATRAPERVEAMVLVSATMTFPLSARAAMRAHGHPQAIAWAQSTDDMAFEPADLAAITAPTMIVYGDRDPLYPVEMAVAMYRAIPRASLWVVPGGGHGPIFGEQAAPFAQAARAFLDQLSPRQIGA